MLVGATLHPETAKLTLELEQFTNVVSPVGFPFKRQLMTPGTPMAPRLTADVELITLSPPDVIVVGVAAPLH